MSRYRIGQKLNVIVESIDRNGKAKFRVINEAAFDSYFDGENRTRYSAYGDDEENSERSANYSTRRQSYDGGVKLLARVQREDGVTEPIKLTGNSDIAVIAKFVDKLNTCGGLTSDQIFEDDMTIDDVAEYLKDCNDSEEGDIVLKLIIDGEQYI